MRARLLLAAVVLPLTLLGCGGAPPPPPAADAPEPVEETAVTGATWDPWQDAKQRGIDVRAIGNEPGWFLEIDHERWMRLLYDYAEKQATLPAVPPVVTNGTTTYAAATDAHSLRVTIDARACSDGMSDMMYPLAVTVVIDGRSLRGCGRDLR